MTLKLKTTLAAAIAATCLFSISAQAVKFPQPAQPGEAHSQQQGNQYVLSNDLFSASFSNDNGKVTFNGAPSMGLLPGSELFEILLGDSTLIPASQMTVSNLRITDLQGNESAAKGSERIDGKAIEATFKHGPLTVDWWAVLRDGSHYLRTQMRLSTTDSLPMLAVYPMEYKLVSVDGEKVPVAVGNTRGAVLCGDRVFAGLETPMGINTITPLANHAGAYSVTGKWSRQTTLTPALPWEVSSVVGLIAPGQKRRSFLAYSERERAVPWRPFPIYNSWYELNIDRNNAPAPEYAGNMTINDCVRVAKKWEENLHKRHGSNIACFVWDDGWDSYGTWGFNPGFPNGFAEVDSIARDMHTGTGAWLGPVGGYGESGEYRRAYWASNGGMQLSNPLYYDTFLGACKNLIDNNDFRFFKFDGISAQFSSVGPDPGAVGDENAEGIINIERQVRKMRPNIFLNTTVGTWASPFWFQFTDAVWRQEGDHGTIGTGANDRETWITYRDRLVHQNFVQNSPLCPINTLMTHGFILTKLGDVSKDMSYPSILNELRCAFACGSGMVELYCDYELLDSIEGGKLWGDMADCIKWQNDNADILPDVHWVGGNPWNGERTAIYGWAAWNDHKSMLTLRNPSTESDTITLTLREALDIPAHINAPIVLSSAFDSQPIPEGLPTGTPIAIDTPLTLTLAPSSVTILSGTCAE